MRSVKTPNAKPKVLLFHPPDSSFFRKYDSSLSLNSVENVLRKNSNPIVFGSFKHRKNASDCFKEINSHPDAKFIGVSVSSYDAHNAKKFIFDLKKKHPDKLIIVGGSAALIDGVTLGRYLNADVVFAAEAENSLNKKNIFNLLEKFFKGKINKAELSELKKVPGLLIFDNERKIVLKGKFNKDGSVPRPSVSEMSSAGIPHSKNSKNVFLVTQRGCPHNCRMCSIALGKALRAYPNKQIISVLENLKKDKSIQQVIFFDSDFLANRERLMGTNTQKGLFELMREKGLHKRFNFVFEANPVNFIKNGTLDLNLIFELKKTNFKRINLGVESLLLNRRKRLNKPFISQKNLFELLLELNKFSRVEINSILSDAKINIDEALKEIERRIYLIKKTNNVFFDSVALYELPLKGSRTFTETKTSFYQGNPFFKKPSAPRLVAELNNLLFTEQKKTNKPFPSRELSLYSNTLEKFMQNIVSNGFKGFSSNKEIISVFKKMASIISSITNVSEKKILERYLNETNLN
jgi:hypothetical protein